MSHRTGLWLQRPQQQSQQSCFASTVRPNHSDFIPAHDHRGKLFHNRQVGVRERDLFHLSNQVPTALPLMNFEPGTSGLLPTLLSFYPHRLECSHPALVARAPGLDPLANPGLFLLQTLVEQRILLFLGRQRSFLPLQERLVVTGPVEQTPTLNFQNSSRQILQESTIVRDKQNGTGPLGQETLQPGNRLDVEVIRRLIQQQEIRVRDQRPGQQHATFHSGRERFKRTAKFQLHPGSNLLNLLVNLPRGQVLAIQTLLDNLTDTALQVTGDILWQ